MFTCSIIFDVLTFTNSIMTPGQERKRGTFGRNGRKNPIHVQPSVIIPGKSLGLVASDPEHRPFATDSSVVAPTSPRLCEPLKYSSFELNGGRDRSCKYHL